MKKLIIFVFLFALLGCTEKKKKPSPTATTKTESTSGKLGSKSHVNIIKEQEYIYLDNSRVWHVKLNCVNFVCIEGKTIGVVRHDPRYIEKIGFCCPACIDDDVYKDLQNIVGTEFYSCHELYERLEKKYSDIDSYDRFVEMMHIQRLRRQIYNAAKEDGIISREQTYSEFSSDYGF